MIGELLTARVVAERLGYHTETVLRWVRDGEIPAIRLPNGAVRIIEDDLDEWLRSRATSDSRAFSTEPVVDRRWRGGLRLVSGHRAAAGSRAAARTEDQEL